MKPLIISFSGGRTSGYMTKYLLDKYSGKRQIIVVFANTGKEFEATLEFVNNCDVHFGFNTVWIESVQNHGKRKAPGFRIVNFKSADRVGVTFEDMIKKHGIPNKPFPHCSRELKQKPILSYIQSLGIEDFEIALGIRYDEPKRLAPKPGIVYPFAHEFPVNKLMVNKWWMNQKFDLMIPEYMGNCGNCWKKSKRKLLTLIVEQPESAVWWDEMEEKYQYHVPAGQQSKRVTPIHFYRENESMKDLIEESKFPFVKAKDTFTLAELMHSEPELDFTGGCGESCEAF